MQYIGNHLSRAAWLAMTALTLSSSSWAGSKLAISPDSPAQLSNSSLQFTATFNKKDVTNQVQWGSSNLAVATITAGGTAKLLAPGTSVITANLKNQTASTVLTVTVATTLNFTDQPGDTSVNTVINPGGGVRVKLIDNLFNPVAKQTVTISIGNNPPAQITPLFGAGVLSGALSQVTDSTGTATFPDLKIDWLGSGYTLVATANASSGPVQGLSAPFNELGVGDPCLWAGARTQTCGFITPCPDGDGDGLPDAWEKVGGLDLKGDGNIVPVLSNVDPVFPDGTPNPTPSADPSAKDVFVKYDWMELPDQLTKGQPTACTLNRMPNPYNIFLPHHSDACNFDQLCLPPQGSSISCNSSGDGCTCKGHTDEPSPSALRMVIDAYAARGVRLHLVKGQAVPHANVTHYGPAPAACTQEFSTFTFSGAQIVNFYDIKSANFHASYNGQFFDEQQLSPVFHYVLFAHRHTCDSINDCNNTLCDPEGPLFNETGRSWKPGNDMIVSMGGIFDRVGSYLPNLAQGGTFMHELGHNLGLDHGGPANLNGTVGLPDNTLQAALNFKPNFISVMNYDFQTIGISSADPNCAPDDSLCRTTPVSTRLDYSSFCPPGEITCDASLQTVPNTLDETNGTEAAGINIGNHDISYTWSPAQTPIPATGPVDFNGDGNETDTWCASGCTFTAIDLNNDGEGKSLLQPFEDWPNLVYQFQCSPIYTTGGGAPDSFNASLLHSHLSRELTTDEVLDKHLMFTPRAVRIQVLPGKAENPGLLQVAIMGRSDLDVTQIDIASLSLHGARPVSAVVEDVNADGTPDLVVSFSQSDVRLHANINRMRMHLSGWLKNGQTIFGSR